jgi:hypothetical protein
MVAKMLWEGLDKTKPVLVNNDEVIDTVWTSGPGEIPGIDTPGALATIAQWQSLHDDHVYFTRKIDFDPWVGTMTT